MKSLIMRLTKNSFIHNVLILSSGTALAQIIGMALTPVITRLYGPEAYGLMGTYTSVLSIFIPIAALTYPTAIVLPKHDIEAKGLIKLSAIVTFSISLIILILLILFHQLIVDILKLERIAFYLYLIPIVVLFAGLLEIIEQWLIRTKQFAVSAKVSVIHSFIINGGKVIVGFFYPVASVLILFSTIKEGLKSLLMILLNKKPILIFNSTDNITERSISYKKLAKKYRDFPLYRAPQVILNSVSESLPVLMLTSLFGPASAGFYSLGRTVLAIPSILLGKSVGDVFYPRISEAANKDEDITLLIKKATFALMAVGVIPYGLVIIFGPYMFGIIFGAEWVTAGEYARWIALWMFTMLINKPCVRALAVISAQSFHLKFTVLTVISRLSLILIGYYIFFDELVAIALFGFSSALLNFILILITLKKSRDFNKFLK